MYLDLYKKLSTDPKFCQELSVLFNRVMYMEEEIKKGKFHYRAKLDKVLEDIMHMCDYNMAIFFPVFFPTLINGKPLDMMRRPFAMELTQLRVGGYVATSGSRQIAKSSSLIARQLCKSFLIPRSKSMYICPHPHHRTTYENRFREMESGCPYMKIAYKKGSSLRNNLSLKEYPNGSLTQLVNVLTDTSQARSKTTDELLYDEYQLFDIMLEGDIEQCQSVSETPMTLYTGTATNVDSPLQFRYSNGSCSTWHVKSPNGVDWINFGNPEEILSTITPEGVKCPYTNQLLDVRNGSFVDEFPARRDYGFVSLHIPQLIIHDKIKDAIEWEKIYKAYKEYNPNKFMEEICGIASEEGSREITKGDLQKICVLGDKSEMLRRAKEGYYSIIISGCDWGGSDYIPNLKTRESTTVHAVLGLAPDGKIHILNLKDYQGQGYDAIGKDIVRVHKEYQGNATAFDTGVGQVYMNILDKDLNPARNFRFNYHAHIFQLLGVPHHGNPNQYTLNKHESFSQLFLAIKNKDILCYDWEDAEPLLSHFLNMYRVLKDGQSGPNKFFYHRSPAKCDDTAHAVNFAYVLMRLLRGDNIVDNPSMQQEIQNQVQQSWNSPNTTMNDYWNDDIISG